METYWNGETMENLLVGRYLNTLCISLNEKEILMEMKKWKKPVCDNFTFLCLSWLKILSDFKVMDGRNEASVMLAKEIFQHDIEFPVLRGKSGRYPQLKEVNAKEVSDILAVYLEQDTEEEYKEFLMKLCQEHRTLQQNFTRVAMKWLQEVEKENPKLSWIREMKICLPYI